MCWLRFTAESRRVQPMMAAATMRQTPRMTAAAMMATATRPAIRPYSMAVAPDGATAPALRATTCSIGYSAVAGGACSGSETNTIAFDQAISPFKETYYGSSPTPRVSIGIGVNWNSPFGPLRIDLAKALVTQPGDDKKLVTFNVGTQF